ALLRPPAQWLHARGASRAAAALLVMGGALAVLAALATVIVPPFVDQLDQLGRDLRAGVEQAGDWLLEGPLNLSEQELDGYLDSAERSLRESGGTIATGVLGGALLVLELIAGVGLAVVITFFFLKDGDRIAAWLVGLFPKQRRGEVEEVGRRAWETLADYLRGMTVVALFDSVFIGLVLVIIGVPAALPLAVFTFFGAYIPIAGALITGIAAVLVALVAEGVTTAAIVALAVLVVQQVESNLLQPFVVGRAVAVHPLAILLAVTAGAVLGGVAGAIVAVPVTAVGARVGGYLRERTAEASLPLDAVDASAPARADG
ncbi:MAG TPA: AI-2E family transporter, partial [Actinomycetota bacterium]|nr:AI-2E family transporter [Actinomycetota bacterium]